MEHRKPRFGVALALCAALSLAACSGDSVTIVPPPAKTLSGSASLGPVANAPVTIYAADGVTVLATTTTGADGSFTISVVGYDGPLVVEISGAAGASYFDEASGTTLPFPAGATLHALLPATAGTIGVTPLTELAYQLAQAQGGALTAEAINAINEQVRAALAPGLASILSLPTVFDTATTAGSLDDTEAGRYALLLAALAELASGDASPALTVLNALIADLADGDIDGANGSTALTVPYSDFINEMTQALQDYAALYGSSALQGSAAAQAPASTQVGGGGGGGSGPNGETVAGTVNVALQAQYTLVAANSQAGSPYTDGDMVAVIVGDGTLQIGDGPVLTSPFHRVFSGTANTAEVIWLDPATNREFALSDNNSGTFNEINVGDASQPGNAGVPKYLGQLKMGETSGGDDPQTGNAGAARVPGANGITGVIDGNEFTYLGTAVVFPNNSGDGILRIDATDPDDVTTKWRVFVPGTLGTYSCDGSTQTTVLQFIQAGGFGPQGGGASGRGACRIKLTRNSGNVVEGYFTGTLDAGENKPLRTVTDGYFKIDSNPPTQSGPIPDGESGMSFEVNGESTLVQPANVLGNTPNFDYMTLTAPNSIGTQIRELPNATGTYTCGQGPAAFRYFHINFSYQGQLYSAGGQNDSGPAGSSCTMTLTAVGTMPASGTDYDGTVEGTFSGTFVAGDGSSITVTNGVIRAFGSTH